MITVKHILVPVDGSKTAYRALERAVFIAQSCGAVVTLLYVIDMNEEINSFEQVSTGGYIPADIQKKGEVILAEMSRDIPDDISFQCLLKLGKPTETIVEQSNEGGYDLIVIGNRGLSQWKRILMGSTSQYVLLHTKLPVLVVK